ncbi:MAG: AMP-polyphosphate phosphotransferase [Thermoleophilaceae bacterium]|nr:AMP-polyphosphate phosphotransferase [Thermoleophilaceae bacterium]
MGHLDEVDLSLKLPKKDREERLERSQKLLAARRLQMAGKLGGDTLGPPFCLVFEGWDASGKGGAIKRLVAELDSRHVRVAQFAAPTDDEKRHHYLARFVPKLPGWGGMAVYDRSWYGRVLVERVEGFASEDEWQRAYEEIVAFEEGLHREGMALVKFWLHISDKEQLKRFERRQKIPLKAWKLTEEDWRNREKRPAYLAAVEDMLERTEHPGGPWHVIPAESKKYARQAVIDTAIAEAERAMREHGIQPIDPEELGF